MEGLSLGSIIAGVIGSVIYAFLAPLKDKLWAIFRKKDIELLQKELSFLKKIKESDYNFSLYLFSAIFKIIAVVGALLLFHAALAFTSWKNFSVLVYWLCGGIIYWISCDLHGLLQKLKKYDETTDRLNQKIKLLKNKIKNNT